MDLTGRFPWVFQHFQWLTDQSVFHLQRFIRKKLLKRLHYSCIRYDILSTNIIIFFVTSASLFPFVEVILNNISIFFHFSPQFWKSLTHNWIHLTQNCHRTFLKTLNLCHMTNEKMQCIYRKIWLTKAI